jgi:hypothetical protein
MQAVRLRFWLLLSLMVTGLALTTMVPACALRGQRYEYFQTRTPLAPEETLVIGFLGGREPWNHPNRGVTRLARKLRERNPSLAGVHVETVENMKRGLALRLVREALDRDADGTLSDTERAGARVIVYGQSFGGAAVVKFAKQLEELNIPVLLTVQVDSVGAGDAVIPANVRAAANFYQSEGLFVRGEREIRAADPQRTKILGNFHFSYRNKHVPVSDVLWIKKVFVSTHLKMDFDPEMWAQVETLILEAIQGNRR